MSRLVQADALFIEHVRSTAGERPAPNLGGPSEAARDPRTRRGIIAGRSRLR